MKVQVDCIEVPKTTRRATDPLTNAARPENVVTIRVLEELSPNGDPMVEVAGPPLRVKAWLRRHGYGEGEYEVVER